MKEVAQIGAPVVLPTPSTTPLPFPVAACFPHQPEPEPKPKPKPVSIYYSNGAFRLDLNNNNNHQHPAAPSPVLENLNICAPFKSFTSLLTGADDDLDFLPSFLKEQNSKIDQIIQTQGDHLRRILESMQRRQYEVLECEAEERAAKKLKEKELELNQVARKLVGMEIRENLFQKENQILKNRVRRLEETNNSLRAELQEAILRGGKVERSGSSELDDVESAHVDPHRIPPLKPVARNQSRW
ncbi:hypothetical protein ACH5RR_016931 [Cinchona calisaya]|uniref:Uncharacterized protein n=1 Tax=Cinchona calisaya TaxID=153742 RepID=A0ABD2ZXG0_9GENT